MLRQISVPLLLLAFALALGSPFPVEGEDAPAAPQWQVVDSAHRPLAGVEVWRVYDEVVDQYSRWTFPPPVLLGVTGADGRVSTRGFDSTRGNVLACKVGYLIESWPSSGPGASEVVLEPAARLSGRVLTPEGRSPAASVAPPRPPRGPAALRDGDARASALRALPRYP